MKNQQADRQHYIDWLRVGAMFLLLFYHNGRLFDNEPWHIKNAVLNQGIEIFNRFLDIWHMPLFFFWPEPLSGSLWDTARPAHLPKKEYCVFLFPWFSVC